jgi:hypothetical protein
MSARLGNSRSRAGIGVAGKQDLGVRMARWSA